MALNPQKYVRRPFAVDAVEVTDENIYEVAKWCGGKVKTDRWGGRSGQKFIRVDVAHPLNERQTMAYSGDWVLSSGTGPTGFKVYTPKAFKTSFEQMEDMVETAQRMDDRATAEEAEEEQEETLEFGDLSKLSNADPLRPFSQATQH